MLGSVQDFGDRVPEVTAAGGVTEFAGPLDSLALCA